MEIFTALSLTALYKAADAVGIVDYVKKLPEKTLDAIYQKLLKDKVFTGKHLPAFLKRGDGQKIFEKALKAVAPDNASVKRKFFTALLSDPKILEAFTGLQNGALPEPNIFKPALAKVVRKNKLDMAASQFYAALKTELSQDDKLYKRVMLELPDAVRKLSEEHQILISGQGKILDKLGELAPATKPKQKKPAQKIFVSKLPSTGKDLFGREQELALLDRAWADAHSHIFSLVAWGGVGKSALVNEWLNRIERDNYRGAERVYGWSFYSQGTREDRQVSGDEFLAHALKWFGDPDPAQGHPWDKGVRLAELIRAQKTLLVLDGLEPLQYPPGEMQGRLKDPGVQALLKELGRANPGLCVLTTRVQVEDLAHTVGKSTQRIELENLAPEAGAQLLQSLDVIGTDKELQQACADFGGHALALNLLGRYLAVVHSGEIRKRDLIPKLTEEERHGGHARRVMLSYEKWLHDTPELNILYMMGLFDRPAAKGAIDALRAEPAIAGLTDKLLGLSEAKWQYAVRRLRDLHLLAAREKHRPDTLDCHPLVREHFGDKLRRQNPAAWQEAHNRLYEYYKNLPAKHLPDTLEEMEPLFAAVVHGCQAERHQEALDEVYWERIRRKTEAYSVKKLGAFGSDLSVLSNFFEALWRYPASGLTDDAKAVVLNWVGFRLRALGRLREAAQPIKAGMEIQTKKEDWKNAAIAAGNLSELYLILGEFNQAVVSGRQSVEFVDRSKDYFRKVGKRATLADVLHQSGEVIEAKKLFRKAEAMLKQRQSENPYLYSLSGFQFYDLLLSQGQYQEVQKRALQTIEIAKRNHLLLHIALHNLSFGRVFLLEAQAIPLSKADKRGCLQQAGDYLREAVAGLREAGQQQYLPLGLFARAACYRVQKKFAPARANLEEAREIAERGEMNLFLADYHLEACRLCLAERKQEAGGGRPEEKMQEAREHFATAKEMIEKMGYGRRKPEVAELEKQL